MITGCCGLEDLVGFLRDMWVVRGRFELLEKVSNKFSYECDESMAKATTQRC